MGRELDARHQAEDCILENQHQHRSRRAESCQQGSEVPFQQHAQRQDDGHADNKDLQHLVDTLHGLVPEQVGIAGDGVQRGYELIDQAGPDDDKVDIECLGNEGSPVLAGIEQRQGDDLPYHRDQQLAAQKVHEICRDHQSAGDDHPHLLTEIQ